MPTVESLSSPLAADLRNGHLGTPRIEAPGADQRCDQFDKILSASRRAHIASNFNSDSEFAARCTVGEANRPRSGVVLDTFTLHDSTVKVKFFSVASACYL